MRIISRKRLREFWDDEPRSEVALLRWHEVVKAAAWKSPADVKAKFGKNVDFVEVESGTTVGVFNAHGNAYRIIAAIHYVENHPKNGRVYVLRVMTHEEYVEEKWKEES